MNLDKVILAQLLFVFILCLIKINTRSLQTSTNQSPINLLNDLNLYQYSNAIYISKTSYVNLTNPIIYAIENGKKFSTHDLLLGSISLNCNGTEYEYKATELLFFLPSEHSIEKEHAQIEMQIHHTLQSTTSDSSIKKKLIISLFFLQLEDYTNEFIRCFVNFRDEGTEEDDLYHTIGEQIPPYAITNHSICDLNKLVKRNKMFYYYEGSTTILPIEDDVAWMIMNYFFYLSTTQYQKFERLIKKYLNKGNNREIQTNDNPVYLLYNNTITINMVFNNSSYLNYRLIDIELFAMMWIVICLI